MLLDTAPEGLIQPWAATGIGRKEGKKEEVIICIFCPVQRPHSPKFLVTSLLAGITKPPTSHTEPMKIFAAAHTDSAAVVAMVICIIQAIFLMMYCITPQ